MTLKKDELFLANSGDIETASINDSNRAATGNVLAKWLARWNGTDVAKIEAQAGTDTGNKDEAELAFFTSNAGSMSEVFRLLQNGDAKIINGNLVFAAGKGVSFDPYAAGNLFDDYEEGSWIPVFECSDGDFSVSGAWSRANYIKIGNMCYVSALWIATGVPTGALTGALKISGIPFPTAEIWVDGLTIVRASNIRWPTSAFTATQLHGYVIANDEIALTWQRDDAGEVTVTAEDFDSASLIFGFNMWFQTS